MTNFYVIGLFLIGLLALTACTPQTGDAAKLEAKCKIACNDMQLNYVSVDTSTNICKCDKSIILPSVN